MSLAALKTDRSTKTAIMRVMISRAQMAQDELAAHGCQASLHELRKRVKELRGMLRLLRPGLKQARIHDGRLRDAARALSPARDLEVMLGSFDTVTARLREPKHFDVLRDRILARMAATEVQDRHTALRRYAQSIHDLQADLTDLRLSEKASHLLWAGTTKTFRAAQRHQQAAQDAFAAGPDATPFHEWRKWVKRHWYQARFLVMIRPKEMKAHLKSIDTLGLVLGTHNDLDVMMHFLETEAAHSPELDPARAIFRRHVLHQRKQLAQEALDLAQTTLATPPETLIACWQGWWRDWRAA